MVVAPAIKQSGCGQLRFANELKKEGLGTSHYLPRYLKYLIIHFYVFKPDNIGNSPICIIGYFNNS